ncbi:MULTISPECIES: SGNH/GDSL hydrolase family protein [unclassified Streptomyces]|uniref:SGNH/GDSL hydrolase family protein n=1 Tax=unclassified Streptomyces TaxID=2593676 RepID=UPI002E186D7F|nr:MULTISPECIES: SGNH/GDSL hydrolase family protein [unclassified Streptomyces]
MFKLLPQEGTTRLPEAAGDTRGTTEGQGARLRLAVLGDSTAAGVGAVTHRGALAGQLAEALTALTGRGVSWRVAAKSGATVESVRCGLLSQLTDPLTRWTPELVLVAVGVNDARRLRRPRVFRREVGRLVRDIRLRLGHDVPIVFAGLPSLERAEALAPGIKYLLTGYLWLLDRQLRIVAEREVSVFHLLTGGPPRIAGEWFAADRLHPSPQGYRAWARTLAAGIAPLTETATAGS